MYLIFLLTKCTIKFKHTNIEFFILLHCKLVIEHGFLQGFYVFNDKSLDEGANLRIVFNFCYIS